MTEIVLFGTGSSIIVDIEDVIKRCGYKINVYIKNRNVKCWASQKNNVIEAKNIDSKLLEKLCFSPIFSPSNRRICVFEATKLGFTNFASLIDPSSILSPSVSFEAGTYVGMQSVIGASSQIGKQCFINRGVMIGHHFRCQDFVSIGPGVTISGHVEIESDVLIGAGAVLCPNVKIGKGSVISAGTVVKKDIPQKSLVFDKKSTEIREYK